MILVFIFTFLNAVTTINVDEATIEAIEWRLGDEHNIPLKFESFNNFSELPVKGSYWVKVNLTVSSPDSYVLVGGNRYMKNLRFYDERKNLLIEGNYAEIFMIEGNYTYYIYYQFIDFQERSTLNVHLVKALEHQKKQMFFATSRMFFVSIMIFLFFLSAAFFAISRGKELIYFYYAWYLLSIVFFFSYQFGMLGTILPIINSIPPPYLWISSASLSMSYLFFAQAFLDLQRTDPRINKVVIFGKYFILFVVLIETITYFFGYDILHSVVYKGIVVMVQVTLLPYILYRVYIQKTILSWIFVVGATILALTTIFGQIASTFKAVDITNFYLQIGLLIEVFIFSVGIGLRMWIIDQEKRKVQNNLLKQTQENLAIHKKYSEDLEQEVYARTKDLHIKNQEKEMLLKEIHHRVKNNLQIVASLLSLQQNGLDDKMAISAIEESANRVRVMGLIHKFLYQQDSYVSIDLKNYIAQLIDLLIDSYNIGKHITKKLVIDSIQTDIDTAIKLGLILNELVTNSIKHAFKGIERPELNIKVKFNNNLIKIELADNGDSKEIGNRKVENGFGWKLIHSLVKSLKGNIDIVTQKGVFVSIVFPNTTAPHVKEVYSEK